MKNADITPESIARLGRGLLNGARRYAGLLFFLLLPGLYSFVLLQINSFSNLQPRQDEVDAQVHSARIPHIDSNVITQLKTLKDNSVNVQSLFDQSRTNPFNE